MAVHELELGLASPSTCAVVNVVDATRLERSLFLLLQLLPVAARAGVPVLVVANIVDEVKQRGGRLDLEGLSHALGVPVLGVSGRSGEGLPELRRTLETWQAVGGSGNPAAAPEAEQDRRAAALYAQAGSSPWPTCG